MVEETFFDEQTDESEVKSRIVEKYFDAWSRVILPTAKKLNRTMAYVDLYAGPGRYRDGSASTPILVLQRTLANPDLCERLEMIFNDVDENNSSTLQREINSVAKVGSLKYRHRAWWHWLQQPGICLRNFQRCAKHCISGRKVCQS